MKKQTEVIGDKVVIRPMYKEGQQVYHIAPESGKGTIVDWVYRSSSGLIYYTIALGFNEETICLESEVSLTPTF